MFSVTKKIFLGGSLSALMMLAGMAPLTSQAAPLDLADAPLIASGANPNVVLTVDDSGSMSRAYIPDNEIDGQTNYQNQKWFCSSYVNGMYYDPSQTYLAPVDSAGVALSNGNDTFTSFANARSHDVNPFTANGTTRTDLSSGYRPYYDATNTGTCGIATWPASQRAFYYVRNNANANCTATDLYDNDCYTYTEVSVAQEANFAIWFSFYRNRLLATKTIIGRAFKELPNNMRVAAQVLNYADTAFAATRWLNSIPNMQLWPDARTDFYTKLYNTGANSSTPLRLAMQRAGNYYSTNSPYRIDPTDGSSPELSCRQNFHLMFTDGYWNNANDTGLVNPGNVDGSTTATFGDLKWRPGQSNFTTTTDNSYDPSLGPYTDGWSNHLADIAMYYYMNDLRGGAGGLTNNVPQYIAYNIGASFSDSQRFYHPKNDPAYWQHMVNFTIGLGVSGTLNPANYNDALKDAANNFPAWPQVTNFGFFSARNAQQLTDAFLNIIDSVNSRAGAAAAIGANSTSLGAGTRIYQAAWGENWSGSVKAFDLDPVTGDIIDSNTGDSIVPTPTWQASIPSAASRNIFTFDPTRTAGTRGQQFTWLDLNATQQNYLADDPMTIGTTETTSSSFTYPAPIGTVTGATVGAQRLSYLRGDRTDESTAYAFRQRTSVLGDIVNSSPQFAGKIDYGYINNIEGNGNLYSDFRTTIATRTDLIYVGANDGMLHALEAATGAEVMAYVPNLVFANLNKLTSPGYSHRYYVDGTPTIADTFGNFTTSRCGGGGPNCWRTVLVGGLGHGGKGYYALDITNPANFSQSSTNADKLALWEYTDTEMGFSYGTAAIVKTYASGGGSSTGRTVAMFGNGYNNTGNGRAYLYVVDIATGAQIAKIDTGVGDTTTPNGLSTPTPVDVDGDGKIDYVYAGDIQGNLWKFNVRSTTASNWELAANRLLLYAGGANRPITVRPDVARHETGAGFMVYFGTGKFIEKADLSTSLPAAQRFYGIWDKNDGTVVTADTQLLEQTITSTLNQTTGEYNYRVTSNNSINYTNQLGWYLTLSNTGERVIADAEVRGNRILFVTAIPGGDSCSGGGTGWEFVLDRNDGSRLELSPFDVNSDGLFDSGDLFTGNAASGRQLRTKGGLITKPTIINTNNKELDYKQTSSGDLVKDYISGEPGQNKRISWRQLK